MRILIREMFRLLHRMACELIARASGWSFRDEMCAHVSKFWDVHVQTICIPAPVKFPCALMIGGGYNRHKVVIEVFTETLTISVVGEGIGKRTYALHLSVYDRSICATSFRYSVYPKNHTGFDQYLSLIWEEYKAAEACRIISGAAWEGSS